MSFNLSFLLRSALVAHDELRRSFGRLGTARLLLDVGRRNAKGRPFSRLPGPRDLREAETRRELAPAVNLFHALRERIGEERAFPIARNVILNSSLIHLRAIYPDFERDNFLALSRGGAGEASERLATDFAFADTEVVELSRSRASFDVVHCRIPETLRLVGAERLATVFCEVDSVYFKVFEPGVRLERSQTIARGGDRCDFRLTWRER